MALHCVGNYEQNLYHDSYFWSVFWDDEAKKIIHHEVGATAYAGGACRTSLTDSAQVWIEAKAFVDRIKAKHKAESRAFKAKRLRDARSILRQNGVNTCFSRAVHIDDLEDIAALFNPRVRNSFKLKMRDVVRAWRPGGPYDKPLSKGQLAYVRRPMKDQWNRENALYYKRHKLQMEHNAETSILRGFGSE